jgi:hypothetical protein
MKSIVVPDPDPSSPFLFSDANVRDVLPQPAHLHTKWIVRPVPEYGNLNLFLNTGTQDQSQV